MDILDLDNRFTYHAPSAEQTVLYDEIRGRAFEFAAILNVKVPEGREKSLAHYPS
jgi:hypothetical protein